MIIGRTNKIVYPQEYFVPEDENRMYDDNLNWCLGVNEKNEKIMFKINLNIEKIKFDENGVGTPVIGENSRIRGNKDGKVLPAIYNYNDNMEQNFYCVANENNSMENNDGSFGVILLSKVNEIKNENLIKVKEEFKKEYDMDFPEVSHVVECGYSRVLSQGVPQEMNNQKKSKIIKKTALPIFGLGRLEISYKKPTENQLLYKIKNAYPEVAENLAGVKNHVNNFKSVLKEYQDARKELNNNPDNQELKNLKIQKQNELNQFKGVEFIRDHTKGLKAISEIGEMIQNVESMVSISNASPEDEKIKQDIINERKRIEEMAIENNIADFSVKIFHPEDIVESSFEPDEIIKKIENIYRKYTVEGSYGGVLLRISDKENNSIPKLSFEIRCKFIRPGETSDASSDFDFAMKNNPKWSTILKYLNQGLKLDLVPFSYIKTPGVGKNSYKKISTEWVGNVTVNMPSSRDLYQDPLTGEKKNTYIAVMRRMDSRQKGSCFVINVIATGFDGEAPSEYEIDEKGEKSKKIRNKK